MVDCAPLPMATSAITAATPMIIPSIVRLLRILFVTRASSAIRSVTVGDMARHSSPAGAGVRSASLSALPALSPLSEASGRRAHEEWAVRGRGAHGLLARADIGDDLGSGTQAPINEL